MDDEGGGALICQACFAPTMRRCSECGACVFCSDQCERDADRTSCARIACNEHRRRTREAENIGECAAHFVMMPSTSLNIVPHGHKGTQWQTLLYGAMHYLQVLIASSSQLMAKKTAFGMFVAITPDNRFAAGRQRLNFLDGKQIEAAAMVVRNMSELVYKRLEHGQVPFARHKLAKKGPKAHKNKGYDHSDYNSDCSKQACIVSGLVLNEGVHFDAIFLTLDDEDDWVVHGVQPLWMQNLACVGRNRYKMNFKMDGVTPAKPRHSKKLLDDALNPAPAPAPAPESAPAPEQAAVPRPQTPLEPPVLRLPPSLAECPEEALPPTEAAPESAEADPPPLWPLPPHLAQALAEAEASGEAPPWTQQLQQALQGA